MKKNLLYLWALVCSVSLLAACSSDDDNTVNDETAPPEEEAVITAPDVVYSQRGRCPVRRRHEAWKMSCAGSGVLHQSPCLPGARFP